LRASDGCTLVSGCCVLARLDSGCCGVIGGTFTAVDISGALLAVDALNSAWTGAGCACV
jgi:hypothetical protein